MCRGELFRLLKHSPAGWNGAPGLSLHVMAGLAPYGRADRCRPGCGVSQSLGKSRAGLGIRKTPTRSARRTTKMHRAYVRGRGLNYPILAGCLAVIVPRWRFRCESTFGRRGKPPSTGVGVGGARPRPGITEGETEATFTIPGLMPHMDLRQFVDIQPAFLVGVQPGEFGRHEAHELLSGNLAVLVFVQQE
jgi:hypothetical protein